MNKYAGYTASSWEDYSSQGPAFKELENWWKNNWQTISGAKSAEYSGWTEWYVSKYYGEWDGIHRGPEETLRVMRAESGAPTASSPAVAVAPSATPRGKGIGERLQNVRQMLNGKLPRGDFPNKNPGVNFADLSDETQEFLKAITGLAKEMGLPKPFVTSGYRSPAAQARAMANNWEKKGGSTPLSSRELELLGPSLSNAVNAGLEGRPITKGAVYLYNLYQMKSFAFFVNNTLHDYGVNRESKGIIADWIQGNVPLRSHMGQPATSVDLRLTQDIKKILDAVVQSGEFTLGVLFEGDHYHIRVRGMNSVA